MFRVGEIAGLWVPRWVQNALNMTARTQDKLALATENLRGRITPPPGCDMVGGTGNDEGVVLDLRTVDRRAQECQHAGVSKRIFCQNIQQITVKLGG